MPKQADRRKARFHMESLEKRELMAGDLFVAAGGGNLLITDRDLESNVNSSVQVQKISPTQVRVTGLPDATGRATLINGRASGLFNVAPAGALTVNLGGGDDMLQVAGGTYSGVFINMDAHDIPQYGRDRVFVTNVTTTGDLQIKTGGGNDTVDVFGTTVGDHVGDSLLIVAGDGSDEVRLNSTYSRGSLQVYTFGNFYENTTDQVSMSNVAAGTTLVVSAGAGNDVFDLNYISANWITVATSDGNDTVRLREVQARDTVFVSMGDHDDRLEVNFCHAYNLSFDGGLGRDTLSMINQRPSNSAHIVGFEPLNAYFSSLGAATAKTFNRLSF